MRDIALSYLYEQDTFTAVEYLCRQPDTLAAARTFADLVRHLYWEKKDVHQMCVLAQAGIQFDLVSAQALDAPDAALAAQLRGIAKGLAYDLGSFTWPGWDEPGIVLQEAHVRLGREAAQVNLRLAHELHKSNLPLSRACWLLGAHFLAAGEQETAHSQFVAAAQYAQIAGAGDEALLCEGYQRLAAFLAHAEETAYRDFLAIQNRLKSTTEGASLAQQLHTAWKVFAGNAAHHTS